MREMRQDSNERFIDGIYNREAFQRLRDDLRSYRVV
jgi:hypothetical protein